METEEEEAGVSSCSVHFLVASGVKQFKPSPGLTTELKRGSFAMLRHKTVFTTVTTEVVQAKWTSQDFHQTSVSPNLCSASTPLGSFTQNES